MAEIRGLNVVIDGLESFGLEVREAAFYAVIEAMQKAFEACKTVISAQDHTLKELALMGHPYSAAHGFPIHDPDVVVHMQSGRYESALKATSPQGAQGSIIEGRIDMSGDPEMQELDEMIQGGTLRMREREWMKWIMDNYGQDYADLIEARITDAVRQARAA